MTEEPQTPLTLYEDSFTEMKPPVFGAQSSSASTIQAKLNRRLGPEYVSQRPAPGGGPKLTYVEGWKIIGLANDVFGYNGWCSNVTRIETDFIDMDPESRRFSAGITALVKITLRDGTYHEDIGYGSGENLKSKGAALDKAKKEAVTDGVKRALRNFGNLLGLCLYEKSFTQEVVKIKPHLPKFDESDLHRREPSASILRPASTHDVSSTTYTEPLEDTKPLLDAQRQIRQAVSKPSPLRNAVLGVRTRQAMHGGEQMLTTGSRTAMSTARERNILLTPQTSCGNRDAPLNKARPPHPDRSPPPEMQLPQQRPSPQRNVASTSSSGRPDRNSVPPPLKAFDSDPDIYFNDEDNDALFAVDDTAVRSVGSSSALTAVRGDAQDRVCDPDQNTTGCESSGSAASTCRQVAISPVRSLSQLDH
ncbi:Rad52/22 family double-strand break repair protein-domain-containing protein [Russula earlei]|uniref:Rad52/22 family double-strand break repair protein-domain-containing protein n=1 Tax=Russula earlei TaxID=71964 RepID=A0ACC0U4Z2_9AGAM|nr:Rad52/22 family double-strand break repair protein-domain-containing protein [Russula earlei]